MKPRASISPLKMGIVTAACTFWESCQGSVRQLVTPKYGSHKHREGSSCVAAGSLGEWGAHDHAPGAPLELMFLEERRMWALSTHSMRGVGWGADGECLGSLITLAEKGLAGHPPTPCQ